MSAIRLPMERHVKPHFFPKGEKLAGMCRCPCDECTTRLTRQCVCLDCPCEGATDHEFS